MAAKSPSNTCPDLRTIRERLGLSQAEFASLLGFSLRAVQSCEQGWRKPSASLQKMGLLLLMADRHGTHFSEICCWKLKNCAPEVRDKCVAYRSRQGHLCWFLTGTLCGGQPLHTWLEKETLCCACPVFRRLIGEDEPRETA